MSARYDAYLASAHWQEVRAWYQENCRAWRCWVCHRTDRPLDLHHKTYKRLGHERLKDLVPLCRACHKEAHELFARWQREGRTKSKFNLWTATRGLRREKGLTPERRAA